MSSKGVNPSVAESTAPSDASLPLADILEMLRAGTGTIFEMSDDQIRRVVDHAAARDREVRIVVNTMPSSTEIPMFIERVRQYAGWGARGFMVSDVGCMRLLREQVPEAQIHTSVGCGITNVEDVHFLAEQGASYVVLPYRLSVQDIAEITSSTGVGIEVFLFKTPSGGKICPGKCMMSSYFSFQRELDEQGKDMFYGSASRGGDCLRVCQTNWRLNAGGVSLLGDLTIKGNPALWLDELPDYLGAGVNCLKVPGRDRSVGLVREITRLYRRAVDLMLSTDEPDLSPFREPLDACRQRWRSERGRRDARLVDQAESIATTMPKVA